VSVVYEVVRSRVRPGAEEDMLRLRPRMISAVRERFPELLDARLVQLDDGSWLDLVQWTSREAAERAAASMAEIPEAAAMGELLDEIVSFEHGVDREPLEAR
jgi:hypothetical protein